MSSRVAALARVLRTAERSLASIAALTRRKSRASLAKWPNFAEGSDSCSRRRTFGLGPSFPSLIALTIIIPLAWLGSLAGDNWASSLTTYDPGSLPVIGTFILKIVLALVAIIVALLVGASIAQALSVGHSIALCGHRNERWG